MFRLIKPGRAVFKFLSRQGVAGGTPLNGRLRDCDCLFAAVGGKQVYIAAFPVQAAEVTEPVFIPVFPERQPGGDKRFPYSKGIKEKELQRFRIRILFSASGE